MLQSICFGFRLWILQCWEEPRISVRRAWVLVRAMMQETEAGRMRSGCSHPLPLGITVLRGWLAGLGMALMFCVS